MTAANGAVSAVGLQEDGKILSGGAFSSVNGWIREGVALLHGAYLPPDDIVLSGDQVEEHRPAGTVVGNFSLAPAVFDR